MLERIHVTYRLSTDPDADRSVVERVRGLHAEHCPVARSIRDAIDITTRVEYA